MKYEIMENGKRKSKKNIKIKFALLHKMKAGGGGEI